MPVIAQFWPDDAGGWVTLMVAVAGVLGLLWAVLSNIVRILDRVAMVPVLLAKLDEIKDEMVTKTEMQVHTDSDTSNFAKLEGDIAALSGKVGERTRSPGGWQGR